MRILLLLALGTTIVTAALADDKVASQNPIQTQQLFIRYEAPSRVSISNATPVGGGLKRQQYHPGKRKAQPDLA
jgi:hypothetical protein